MDVLDYMKQLDSVFGLSGREHDVAEKVKEIFSKYCNEVTVDSFGNVIGRRSAKSRNAPSVMLEAHMDELGLMVSRINEHGSLNFVTIGGFDPKVLPGTEVTVHAKEPLFGVIGAKPPHLITDRSKAPSVSELTVDIGLDEKHAKELVSVGDIITINTGLTKLGNSFAAARCFDDRGGLALIMRVLEMLDSYELDNEIIAVAAVQEEVGLRGARVSAGYLQPSCAVSIDVCHGTSPGVSEDAYPCGKGPVVTIGPNINPKLSKKLLNISKENEIPVQLEVCEGDTGTDAWEIQIAGNGIPVGLISVPLRYMHGNYEVASCEDIENGAKLLAMFAANYKGGEFVCW